MIMKNEFVEEDAKMFGREYLGPEAGPFLMPYVNKRRFQDTQQVDHDCDIKMKEYEYRGCEFLWELSTRKNVNKGHLTSADLRKYKKILLLPNAHLEGYQPGGVIRVGRRKNFREIIAPLFAKPKSRVRIRVTPCMEKY